MTGRNIEEILRDEAEYSAMHKVAPLRDGTILTHKNQRSSVFSIRLLESERSLLDEAARRTGVGASSLARQWIAERLASQNSPRDVDGVVDALETLAGALRSYGTDSEGVVGGGDVGGSPGRS